MSKSGINKEATLKVMKIQYKVICLLLFPSCVCVWVQSEQQRELTQIQYLAWPDHGVPDDSTDFLDFVALVRTKRARQDQPMVVHCRYSCSFCELFQVTVTHCLMNSSQPLRRLLFQCGHWPDRGSDHHGDGIVFNGVWPASVSSRYSADHERPESHDDPNSRT